MSAGYLKFFQTKSFHRASKHPLVIEKYFVEETRSAMFTVCMRPMEGEPYSRTFTLKIQKQLFCWAPIYLLLLTQVFISSVRDASGSGWCWGHSGGCQLCGDHGWCRHPAALHLGGVGKRDDCQPKQPEDWTCWHFQRPSVFQVDAGDHEVKVIFLDRWIYSSRALFRQINKTKQNHYREFISEIFKIWP